MDKISVVIPCYNSQRYIADCLNSVLTQTHTNIEIICINDGSTDDTLAVLNQFRKEHVHLIKVISVENNGASAARNIGVKASTGDFIQFLDSDDVIAPEKFEMQLKAFSNEIDVVVSDRVQKNIDLSEELKSFCFDEIEINPLETVIKRVIITGNPLYRRAVVLDLNGYDETLLAAQDWDFNIRMVLGGFKIKYLPGIFFVTRKVSNSISSNWIKVSIQAAEVILHLKNELLKNAMLTNSIREYLSQIYLDSAIYCNNQEKIDQYIQELKFWSANDFSFTKNRFKAIVAKIVGAKMFVKLEKKRILK